MTAIPCPVCLSETRDGLLCATCTAALRATLRNLPWLMGQLRLTFTKQDKVSRSDGRGGDVSPLIYNTQASKVFGLVTTAIAAWIRDIDEHANPGTTMGDWCAWLTERMPAIRRHLEVEHLYDELTYSARLVWRAIDRPADREYIKPCDICGKGVYAAPGVDMAACGECRRVAERDEDGKVVGFVPEYDVAQAHVTRVAKIRSAVLTPAELRIAVQAIRSEPLSIKTVRSWINRGRLRPKANADGVDLYSVEDALALAAQIPTREPAPRRVVRRVSA